MESWSDSARTLQLRGFCKDSLISHDHVTNADRSIATTTFDIPDIPTMLNVSPSTGPVRRGECYVRVTLLMAGFPVGRLMAAYLTDGKTLTWPPGVQESMTEGQGYMRVVTGTDPDACAVSTEAVPANTRWRIKFIQIQLVCDANVANRQVWISITDGTNVVFRSPYGPNQTASQTQNYSIVSGYGTLESSFSNGLRFNLPPDLLMFQGWVIKVNCASMQADDNFGAPLLIVEEWIEE